MQEGANNDAAKGICGASWNAPESLQRGKGEVRSARKRQRKV
jgi:hypothetical protein